MSSLPVGIGGYDGQLPIRHTGYSCEEGYSGYLSECEKI